MAIGTLLGIGQGLGQVANYLQGRSAYGNIEDEIKRLNALKKNQFIDVNSISSAYERGLAADASKQGARLDKALDFNTGEGMGALLSNQIGAKSRLLGDLRLENQVGKARRNSQIDNTISQLRAGNQKPSAASMLLGLGSTALNTIAQNQATSQAEKSAQEANLLRANTAPKPPGYGSQLVDDTYSPRVDFNQLGQQGVNQASGYNYDNAGGFNQPQQTQQFKNPNEYIAHLLQSGGLSVQDYLTKFGTVGSKKTEKTPDYVPKINNDLQGLGDDYIDYTMDYNKLRSRERAGLPLPQRPTMADSLNVFNTNYRPQIESQLGQRGVDSIMNLLGLNQPQMVFDTTNNTISGGQIDPRVDQWAKANLSPEKYQMLMQKSPEEIVAFYRQYAR